MGLLFVVLNLLFNIATGIIIAQVVVSWLIAFGIINADNQAARKLIALLYRITDPVYRPLRKIIPSLGGIDITPIIVLIGLSLLQNLLYGLLFY